MEIAFFYIGVFLFFRDIIQEIQGARPAAVRSVRHCSIGARRHLFIHSLII